MNDLINTLFIVTNPIPVKTVMNIIEMDIGELRLPLEEKEDTNKQILVKCLRKYGLKTGDDDD